VSSAFVAAPAVGHGRAHHVAEEVVTRVAPGGGRSHPMFKWEAVDHLHRAPGSTRRIVDRGVTHAPTAPQLLSQSASERHVADGAELNS
jgi:hypothetical protein